MTRSSIRERLVQRLDRVAACAAPAGRIVWRREDAPAWLAAPQHLPGPSPYDTVQWQANEALTNLHVGLHRDARGEKLSATRRDPGARGRPCADSRRPPGRRDRPARRVRGRARRRTALRLGRTAYGDDARVRPQS